MSARLIAVVAGFLLAVAAVLPAAPSRAAQPAAPGRKVSVEVNKSHVLRFDARIQRVSVGEAKILEVVVASPQEVVVNGKAKGMTTLIVWDERGAVHSYDVAVTAEAPLAQQVREQLASLLPKEQIKVEQAGSSVVLSGSVSSEESRTVALGVAEAVAPKKVVDNLQVDEVPQVLVKVRFAEISRAGALQVGLGFIRRTSLNRDDILLLPGAPGFSARGTFLQPQTTDVGPDISFGSLLNIFVGTHQRTQGLFIRALQDKGYIRTLAEPNLRVLSGKEGNFLVGGEVPIPVPGQDGSVTIVYKRFGIQLKFKPKVLKSGLIELAVEPEVSAIDNTIAVVVSGFTIPGFKTSNTKTEVVLRDGQTMPISGLLSENQKRNMAQIPFIGDVPILGQLFQSKDFSDDKTELVVLVTPTVIRTRRSPELLLPRSGFRVGRVPGPAPAGPQGGRR
ncbi:MAG: pilus assembly protein N-terminal domain-containing protein [Candidatus Tectomicrobia bacterium]|nr:pilus assembly protein N-terminal domain-containing protein [Candidatus Tectomicrobia bacterium]